MQVLDSQVELKDQLEQATVTGLFYYPVKSCAGIAVDEAVVDKYGIRHDRELMLIEAETGEQLTQRELSRMVFIKSQIEQGRLRLEAPGMSVLETAIIQTGQPVTARLWKEPYSAIDQGDKVARWFSEFLETDCRLVSKAPDYVRQVDQKRAVSEQDQVGFADGFPLLLLSEESLADLNGRMDEALPMNRFRPNIVISGSGVAFGEDQMKRITIGEVTFGVVKPCARCKITTTNQVTAEVGKEPLRTLATYRRGENGAVMFGQNIIHENLGTLKIGDKVNVLELR